MLMLTVLCDMYKNSCSNNIISYIYIFLCLNINFSQYVIINLSVTTCYQLTMLSRLFTALRNSLGDILFNVGGVRLPLFLRRFKIAFFFLELEVCCIAPDGF